MNFMKVAGKFAIARTGFQHSEGTPPIIKGDRCGVVHELPLKWAVWTFEG